MASQYADWTTGFRQLAVVAATLLIYGCAADRARVVAAPGFVLVSPFGPTSTDAWRDRVVVEVSTVTTLLHVGTPEPPVTVRIESVDDPGASLLEHLNPRIDGGIGGWATAGDEIHVVVGKADDGLFSTDAPERLRHELAHVLLRRMGVRPASWFDEGFAHEVEGAIETAAGPQIDPVPLQVLLARAYAPVIDPAEVWDWDESTRPHDEREVMLRAVARSFVRFQIERASELPWWSRIREMAAVRPRDNPDLVREWRSWLDEWDAAGRISSGLADADDAVRASAAERLPQLADSLERLGDRVPGLRNAVDERRLDTIALWALDDTTTFEPAARYLCFFRATAMSPRDVERLAVPGASARTRLVGLAIAARRGRHVDVATARSAWASVDDAERRRLPWVRVFLPID